MFKYRLRPYKYALYIWGTKIWLFCNEIKIKRSSMKYVRLLTVHSQALIIKKNKICNTS